MYQTYGSIVTAALGYQTEGNGSGSLKHEESRDKKKCMEQFQNTSRIL